MDIIAITPTQQLLGILLVFLLAWMISFAWLAIRRIPEAKVEKEERAYYQPLPTRTAVTPLSVEPANRIQEVVVQQKKTAELYLEQSVR